LLDTHALLWALASPATLAEDAADAIEDPTNDVLVSAASIWEIAIKARSGKLTLGVPLADLTLTFDPIGITHTHALQVAALPDHHRDPFDRMLISQALVEGLTIVTRDRVIAKYGVPVLDA
jgi:PIN domain nuclease of toxin-antitoxin system